MDPTEQCEWGSEDPEFGMWETSCGHSFFVVEGSPSDNEHALLLLLRASAERNPMIDPTPDEAQHALWRIMNGTFGDPSNVSLLSSVENQMVTDLGVRHVLCRYVDGHVIADVFPHSSPAFRLTYAAATVLA